MTGSDFILDDDDETVRVLMSADETKFDNVFYKYAHVLPYASGREQMTSLAA